jgi:hypothetical protein
MPTPKAMRYDRADPARVGLAFERHVEVDRVHDAVAEFLPDLFFMSYRFRLLRRVWLASDVAGSNDSIGS